MRAMKMMRALGTGQNAKEADKIPLFDLMTLSPSLKGALQTVKGPSTQFFMSNHKCIKINCANSSIDRDSLSEFTSLSKPFLLDVTFDIPTIVSRADAVNMWMLIHEAEKLPRLRDTQSVQFQWQPKEEDNAHEFDYNQITTHYLKYPFHTDCINYAFASDEKLAPKKGDARKKLASKKGDAKKKLASDKRLAFESRGDCLENCIDNEMIQKYGKTARVRTLTKYVKSVNLKKAPKYNAMIDRECVSKCKLNCKTIQFSSILIHSWKTRKPEKF